MNLRGIRNKALSRRFGAFISLAVIASCVSFAQNGAPPATTPTPIPRRLTLAAAEALLIQRNLNVVAAKYQIEAGRAARLLASYKPNPVLTIGIEQLPMNRGLWKNLAATDPNAAAQPTYTIRVDKVIERGGKRELRTEQADFQLKANEAQMLDAVRTQLFQLRQAYAQATLARENLLLAEATAEQYEQTEKLTEAKVENGDLPGVEVYRARAGRLQFQQAVLQARTAYEQATRDVLNLLGARPEDVQPAPGQVAENAAPRAGVTVVPTSLGTASGANPDTQLPAGLRAAPLELVASFDDRPIAQTLSELRAIALAERPDVIAARHTLAATKAAFALARAQRTRDVDLASEYQRIGGDNTFGVTLSIPLFIYNDQRAAAAQAEAQQKASEALLRQAQTQAQTDVEKAYQAYLAARRTLDLYGSQNLQQIEKLRSIAAVSYKEGASSLFELLDAQRTYNAALTAYNQARADYQIALWQLEQAVGRPLR